ncbi:MAG: hypothetical protein ACI9FR_001036 [Cryomorphaceae bacterium]|jgi:hypothetical protein
MTIDVQPAIFLCGKQNIFPANSVPNKHLSEGAATVLVIEVSIANQHGQYYAIDKKALLEQKAHDENLMRFDVEEIMRISLTFDLDDCRLIGNILSEAVTRVAKA